MLVRASDYSDSHQQHFPRYVFNLTTLIERIEVEEILPQRI